MLSGVQRIHRDARMHWIMGCDHHAINIFERKHLGIILEPFATFANERFDILDTLGPNVAHRSQGDVILRRVGMDLPYMGVEALGAHADKTEDEPVVRPGYAGRRRLVLSINRSFEK